jgi:hypothetical protein
MHAAADADAVEFDQRGYVEIRTAAGVLVCKFDPLRDLLEVKVGPRMELIDLRPLRLEAQRRFRLQGKSV